MKILIVGSESYPLGPRLEAVVKAFDLLAVEYKIINLAEGNLPNLNFQAIESRTIYWDECSPMKDSSFDVRSSLNYSKALGKQNAKGPRGRWGNTK